MALTSDHSLHRPDGSPDSDLMLLQTTFNSSHLWYHTKGITKGTKTFNLCAKADHSASLGAKGRQDGVKLRASLFASSTSSALTISDQQLTLFPTWRG